MSEARNGETKWIKKKKKKKTGFRFEPGNFTYKTKRLTSPTKGIRQMHEKKF